GPPSRFQWCPAERLRHSSSACPPRASYEIAFGVRNCLTKRRAPKSTPEGSRRHRPSLPSRSLRPASGGLVALRNSNTRVDTRVSFGLGCTDPGTALQRTPARRGVDAADVTEAVLGIPSYSHFECLGVTQ